MQKMDVGGFFSVDSCPGENPPAVGTRNATSAATSPTQLTKHPLPSWIKNRSSGNGVSPKQQTRDHVLTNGNAKSPKANVEARDNKDTLADKVSFGPQELQPGETEAAETTSTINIAQGGGGPQELPSSGTTAPEVVPPVVGEGVLEQQQRPTSVPVLTNFSTASPDFARGFISSSNPNQPHPSPPSFGKKFCRTPSADGILQASPDENGAEVTFGTDTQSPPMDADPHEKLRTALLASPEPVLGNGTRTDSTTSGLLQLNIARAADAATTQPPTTFQPFNAAAATITSEQNHTEGPRTTGEQILQQEEPPQQDTASFGSLSPVHQNEESTHYLQEGNSAQEFLITPRGVAPAAGGSQQTSGGYLGRPPVAPTSGASLNPAMNQAMIVQPETPPGEDAGVEDETEGQEDNVGVADIGLSSTQQFVVPAVVATSGPVEVATPPPARPGTIQFGVAASDPATKKRRVLGSSKAVVLDIVVDDSTTKPFAEIDAKAPTRTSAGKVQLQQHTEDFTSTSADEQSHRDPGPAGSSSSPEEVQLFVATKNKKQEDDGGEAAPTAPKTPTGEGTTEENNGKSISPLQRIPANTSSPSHTTRGLAKTINGHTFVMPIVSSSPGRGLLAPQLSSPSRASPPRASPSSPPMSSFSAVEAERGEVMIPATAASIVPSAGFFPSTKQSSPKAKSVSPQLHSRILGSTISSPPLAGTSGTTAPAANTTTTNPHGMSRAASATSLQQQHNALANVEPRMQERVLKAFSGSGSSSTTGGGASWLPSSSSSGSATTSAGGPLRRTLRDSAVDHEEQDPYVVSGSTGAPLRPHDAAAPIIPQLNAPRLGSTSSARQEHHVDSAASRQQLEQPSLEEIFDVGGSRSVFSETKDDDSSIRIIGQKGEQEQLVQVENRSRRQIFQDRLFSKLDSDKSKSPKSQHSRSPVLQQRTISPRTRTTTAALRHPQQERHDKSPGRMMSQSMENVSLSTGGFRSASRRQSKENIGTSGDHVDKDHEMMNSLSGSRQILDRSIYEEVLDNVMRSSSKSSSSTVGGNVVHSVPVASSTGLTNQTLQEPLNIEDKPSESESIRPSFAAAEQEQEEQLITRQSLQDKHFREHSTSRKSSPNDLLLHSVNSLSFASAPSRLGLGVYQTGSTNGKMLKRVNVTSEDIHRNLTAVLGGSRASGSTSKSSNSGKKSAPLDGDGDGDGDQAEQHVDQPHDRGGSEALLELAEVVVPYQSEVVKPSAGALAQDEQQRVEQVLVADEFVSQLLVVHPQEKKATSQTNAPPDGRRDGLAVTLNRGSPSLSPRRAPSMGRKSAGAAAASSSSSSYHSRSGAAEPDFSHTIPKETTFSTSTAYFSLDNHSGQQHHEQYSGKKQNSRRSVGAKPEDTSFSELKAATTRARSRERTSTPRGYRSTRTSRMREEQRKRERDQSQGRGGSNVVALMRSLSRTSASGDKNTAVDVMPLRAAGTTAGAAAVCSSTSFVVPPEASTGFSSTGSGQVTSTREAQQAAVKQLRATTTQHNIPHTSAPVSLVQVVPLASEVEDSEGSGGCEGTMMKHTEVVVEQDHAINSSNSRSMNNTTSLSATSYHRTSSSSATKTSARTRGRILTKTQEAAPSAAAGAKTPNRLPSKNLQTSQSATASRSRSAGRYTPRGVSKELYQQAASGSEMSYQGPTASLSSSSGAAAIRSYHNILAAGAQRHLSTMGNSQNSQNTAHSRLPSQQSLVQNLLLAREVGGDSALDGGYYEHNYLHPGGKATPTPATAAGTNKNQGTTSLADHEPQSNAGAYQQGRAVQQGVVPLGSSTASSTNTPSRGLSTRGGTTSNRRNPLLGKVLTPRPETETAEGKTAKHVDSTDRVSKIEASNSNSSSSSRQASSTAAAHDHPTTSPVSSAQQHPSSSPKLSTKTTTPRNAALSQLYVATANRQKQHNSQHYTQNSTIGRATTSSKNTSKTSSSLGAG